MGRRAGSPNEKMNPGVWAAVSVAIVAAVVVANRLENRSTLHSSLTIRSGAHAAADDGAALAHTIENDTVGSTVDAALDELRDVAASMRDRFLKPAVTAAAHAAEVVESIPAAPAARGLWLVLDDLGPAAPQPLRAQVDGALALLAIRGWSLVGLGDSDRDINLAASARSAIGVDTLHAADRLRDWLDDQGDLLKGVLLLQRDGRAETVEPILIVRPEAQTTLPIAQALRAAAAEAG